MFSTGFGSVFIIAAEREENIILFLLKYTIGKLIPRLPKFTKKPIEIMIIK